MRFIIVSLILLLTACSDSNDKTPADSIKHYRNDYSIGQYTAPASGHYATSYWIEGPQGVILIGTQYLAEDAMRAVDIAESYTGKKVVLGIVLHASPDQYQGTSALQERGVHVVSAQSVREQMEQQGISAAMALPSAAWTKTQLFDEAGLQLKAYVIRHGQSPSHVLIELDDHLFVGDLLANRYHSDLSLGRSQQWLERLEEIRKFAGARVIHPGHGYAMNADELLDRQEAYLGDFRKAVAEYYTGGDITELDRKSIAERLREWYPDYPLADLLDAGIEAEWQRLRQQDHMMLGKQNPRS
jgi:glyoxylase-like metal-dependent hydrolase (beta-lactamase superfamily II)